MHFTARLHSVPLPDAEAGASNLQPSGLYRLGFERRFGSDTDATTEWSTAAGADDDGASFHRAVAALMSSPHVAPSLISLSEDGARSDGLDSSSPSSSSSSPLPSYPTTSLSGEADDDIF